VCESGENSDNCPSDCPPSEGGGNGGGGDGGGGGGGGGDGGLPPVSKYNVTFVLSNITEEELRQYLSGVQDVLVAAGFDAKSIDEMAGITKKIYDRCNASMEISHPDASSSELGVGLSCNGKITMEDVAVFIELPKSFAQSSDEVVVSTIPSGKIVVVETDPTFSIQYSQLTLGEAFYKFSTNSYANRDLVAAEWKQPWFVFMTVTKNIPPGCGDGMLAAGEECDGTATEGFRCTDECKLEKITVPACVTDNVCTPEETALGNCPDCIVPEPQCVDDNYCSPEEASIGCADCLDVVKDFPQPAKAVFNWIRASAGSIMLLASLVLLVLLVRLWKKGEKTEGEPQPKKKTLSWRESQER
jgi:hypothetical protein